MTFYDVTMTTGTTLRFQVEANSEDEARRKLEDAYNEYPDEILDAIDAYGDVDTNIVGVVHGWEWDDATEIVPGVKY